MSDVKHKFFFGFKEKQPIDVPYDQSYYLLTEASFKILTEDDDELVTEEENG